MFLLYVTLYYDLCQEREGKIDHQDASEEELKNMAYRFITFFLTLLIYFKMMFFLRIRSKFGNMIALFAECQHEIASFTLFFISLILLFSTMFTLLNNKCEDLDYPELSGYSQIVLHTYRNAIGDINSLGIQYWTDGLVKLND